MDFSLFDEASRDHDAEMAERRTALVRTAVQQEVFPFLALAQTPAEYAHRKALTAQSLTAIAQRCEASVGDAEAACDRMYDLLTQTRLRAAESRLSTQAAMSCANCNHRSVDHTEGLQCSACGCANFTPQSRTASTGKEGRRVTADEGDGPFS